MLTKHAKSFRKLKMLSSQGKAWQNGKNQSQMAREIKSNETLFEKRREIAVIKLKIREKKIILLIKKKYYILKK